MHIIGTVLLLHDWRGLVIGVYNGKFIITRRRHTHFHRQSAIASTSESFDSFAARCIFIVYNLGHRHAARQIIVNCLIMEDTAAGALTRFRLYGIRIFLRMYRLLRKGQAIQHKPISLYGKAVHTRCEINLAGILISHVERKQIHPVYTELRFRLGVGCIIHTALC